MADGGIGNLQERVVSSDNAGSVINRVFSGRGA